MVFETQMAIGAVVFAVAISCTSHFFELFEEWDLFNDSETFAKPERWSPILARSNEIIDFRSWNITCSKKSSSYEDFDSTFVEGCSPIKCMKFVSDNIVSPEEATKLIEMFESTLSITGGSDGPASILDLQSGAISQGQTFINIHPEMKRLEKEFDKETIELYKDIMLRIRLVVMQKFGISKLWPTYPTFFSRIKGQVPPTGLHDEYWHEHVDKETYGSFYYTGLLYLNTHKKDFEGGRFTFIERNETDEVETYVEPRVGRVSVFTSGYEHPHKVQRISNDGVRYAVTMSYTCDESVAIDKFMEEL